MCERSFCRHSVSESYPLDAMCITWDELSFPTSQQKLKIVDSLKWHSCCWLIKLHPIPPHQDEKDCQRNVQEHKTHEKKRKTHKERVRASDESDFVWNGVGDMTKILYHDTSHFIHVVT